MLLMKDNLVSTFPLKPAPGYCVISPITAEEHQGIIIKQAEQPLYVRGWIRRMGEERCEFGVYISTPAKDGDSVYYSASDFESINFKGEKVYVVKQAAIVAIYESKSETSN